MLSRPDVTRTISPIKLAKAKPAPAKQQPGIIKRSAEKPGLDGTVTVTNPIKIVPGHTKTHEILNPPKPKKGKK